MNYFTSLIFFLLVNTDGNTVQEKNTTTSDELPSKDAAECQPQTATTVGEEEKPTTMNGEEEEEENLDEENTIVRDNVFSEHDINNMNFETCFVMSIIRFLQQPFKVYNLVERLC